ncbi:MAG: GcvT family protein [Hyphomicrobiaceae bacterium]
MKSSAEIVIIGGGVMGVSLLYHLARRGQSDTVLLEKNELTAGSTWHAAGLCTHFAHNPTVQELRAASVRLYRDILPEETGENVGFHPCGALRVTRSADRMDEFHHVRGLSQFTGYPLNILTLEELAKVYPLCTLDGLLGAFHEPDDGHVDPTLATNAMAKVARENGATIERHCTVTAIQRDGDAWVVDTPKGSIRAGQIVNTAGTWCREIGSMMGVDIPVVPMLHQYVVTDRVPAIAGRIADGQPELPVIRDPEESWYVRQERDGFIIGPYEKDGVPWSVDGVPPEFGMELLPPDLDRISHIVEMAMARIPALADAGIKTIVNGPITFSPDANPLVGPAFGLANAWLLTGSSMGVMEGGGAGKFLSDWMLDGAPPMDPLAIDARRFGGYADRDYRLVRAIEGFGLQFGVHYPFEEREAGRGRKQTPLYETQRKAGALFGAAYGWERPNWFAADAIPEPPLTFRRPGWQDAVIREARNVQEGVGLADLSPFAKFEISGPDAKRFLDTLGANTPPRRDGRIGLLHALTPAGGIASEFTVTRLNPDLYYLTSAAAAERRNLDLLNARAAGDVRIRNVTDSFGILGLMGPRSRDVLHAVTDADPGNDVFPWLTAQEILAAGKPVRALRVSYVGELGWELHVAMDDLLDVHSALITAGETFGLRPFGAYAMNAMRLEKGYRAWGADLTTERTPLETGLGAFVKTEGRDFIGKDAMLARAGSDAAWQMVLLEVETSGDLMPFYGHTLMQAGIPVGIVTSAAFGPRTGKTLALAFLRPEADINGAFTIRVLDTDLPAAVLDMPPYDPANQRQRS